MRILHVIATLEAESGGPAKACLEMAAAVARLGHEVDIFTTDWRSRAPSDGATPVVYGHGRLKTYPVTHPRIWKTSPGLKRALDVEAKNYDLLHVHSLYLFHNYAAAAAAERAGKPYIVRPHGLLDPYIWRRHRLRKSVMELAFQNRALARAAAIHYTSEDERRISEPHAQGAPGLVIPLGVHAPASQPAARPHPDRVLFLSRLHPKKGLDLLIPAFAALHRLRPGAELVVAGPDDGSLHATRALVASHGLDACVSFPGMLVGDAKDRAFAEAGLFVLPSYSENFGIAVAEAMAAGLPVIVSDQVNIHDDIAAARAGLVVPCDSDRLADAMARLLGDPDGAARMGRNGAALVASKYGWPAIGAQLAETYRRLIDARQS